MSIELNLQDILTTFMVLFAVIDITGSIPVIVNLNATGKKIQAAKASIVSLVILIAFLFVGDGLLKLFHTDIASFAIAGSLVLFALAIEMTFSIEIFRNDNTGSNSTIIPVVFPLVAGPGTLTTALTLRADYSVWNIIIAIIVNVIIVYIVLRKINTVEKMIGKNGIYIARRFFGVILLAISVKLFISNLRILIIQ